MRFHAIFPCFSYKCFLHREYVVDLVGEPGNVHGPDSSINGCFISLNPSPFQVSYLNGFQRPYAEDATSYETSRVERPQALADAYPYSSMIYTNG